MSPNTAQRWLRRFHPSSDAPVQLLCLPHAGGSASFYFPFSQALSGSAEVLGVQYPGRQERHHESGLTELHVLADRITEAVAEEVDDRRLALFGHSMGAVLAFEVAARLEDSGTTVATLFVSGRRAPSRHRPPKNVHTFTDEQLVTELAALDGTDTELLSDPHVLRMILPAVRSDFEAVETYRYRPRPPLRCPVVALTGDHDAHVGLDEVGAWADHTAQAFDLQVFSGGHFYLSAQQAAVVDLVRHHLTAPG